MGSSGDTLLAASHGLRAFLVSQRACGGRWQDKIWSWGDPEGSACPSCTVQPSLSSPQGGFLPGCFASRKGSEEGAVSGRAARGRLGHCPRCFLRAQSPHRAQVGKQAVLW